MHYTTAHVHRSTTTTNRSLLFYFYFTTPSEWSLLSRSVCPPCVRCTIHNSTGYLVCQTADIVVVVAHWGSPVIQIISSDVSPWPWPWDPSPLPWSWPWPSLFSHYVDSHSVPADMEDSKRLEKILAQLTTYRVDTINSVSFESDTKLADICTQMEFVPLGHLESLALDLRPKSLLTSLIISIYTDNTIAFILHRRPRT